MCWIRVKTGARLHLGQVDLNGSLGRLYGGVGFGIQRPCVEVFARRYTEAHVEAGEDTFRVLGLTRAVLERYSLPGAWVVVADSIPAHVGLGSSTQLALSVALAVTRAYGLTPTVQEMARITDREGSRSGVGVGVFERGGLIVDGGRPLDSGSQGLPPLPPVVCRMPFPREWGIVVAIPKARHNFSGEIERRAFLELPPMDEACAGALCRLVLLGLLPAVAERNLYRFGRAITAIQRKVGEHFSPVQGSVFFGPSACLVDFFERQPVAGVGQSSWGPTVYAFCEGWRLASLVKATRGFTGDGADVFGVRGSNRGARWNRVSALPTTGNPCGR
jgi:beta-RFAP synthase